MKFYRRHFLLLDAVLCTLVAFAIAIWAVGLGGAKGIDGLLIGNRGAIYGTMAALLGALLGFIIATLAILVAVVPDERLARLRASGQYSTLWKTLTAAMRTLAIGTLVGVASLIFDRDGYPVRWLELLALWIWLIATARLAWSIWIVDNVVKLLSGSDARP